MKRIMAVVLSIFIVSCSANIDAGKIIKMPNGYTVKQTENFLRNIVDNDFKNELYRKFPSFAKLKKGGFIYQPVIMKTFNKSGTSVGVKIKINDLQNWNRYNDFKQFLESYLTAEVKKL